MPTAVLNAVLAVVVILAAATAYQVIASKIDSRKHPPPGKLVDVGGTACICGVRGQALPWSFVTLALAALRWIGNWFSQP